MTEHFQYVTIRNSRGREMFDLVRDRFLVKPTESSGDRTSFVMQTLEADEKGKRGEAPDPLPKWIGNILAWFLTQFGPKGMEFARYSVDYHYLRNFLHINRKWKKEKSQRHLPKFVRVIVEEYEPGVSELVR